MTKKQEKQRSWSDNKCLFFQYGISLLLDTSGKKWPLCRGASIFRIIQWLCMAFPVCRVSDTVPQQPLALSGRYMLTLCSCLVRITTIMRWQFLAVHIRTLYDNAHNVKMYQCTALLLIAKRKGRPWMVSITQNPAIMVILSGRECNISNIHMANANAKKRGC